MVVVVVEATVADKALEMTVVAMALEMTVTLMETVAAKETKLTALLVTTTLKKVVKQRQQERSETIRSLSSTWAWSLEKTTLTAQDSAIRTQMRQDHLQATTKTALTKTKTLSTAPI